MTRLSKRRMEVESNQLNNLGSVTFSYKCSFFPPTLSVQHGHNTEIPHLVYSPVFTFITNSPPRVFTGFELTGLPFTAFVSDAHV